MARIETRLAKLEAQVGCQIAPNQRDPELVDFCRWLAGKDFSLEGVPYGVSAKPFIHRVMTELLASAWGTSLPVVP